MPEKGPLLRTYASTVQPDKQPGTPSLRQVYQKLLQCSLHAPSSPSDLLRKYFYYFFFIYIHILHIYTFRFYSARWFLLFSRWLLHAFAVTRKALKAGKMWKKS